MQSKFMLARATIGAHVGKVKHNPFAMEVTRQPISNPQLSRQRKQKRFIFAVVSTAQKAHFVMVHTKPFE
jgi:hypothetical protein